MVSWGRTPGNCPRPSTAWPPVWEGACREVGHHSVLWTRDYEERQPIPAPRAHADSSSIESYRVHDGC